VVAVEFREVRGLLAWIGLPTIDTADPEGLRQIAARFNESDRLLLFGDLSEPSKAEQMKALWRSELGSPAYFAEYARALLNEARAQPKYNSYCSELLLKRLPLISQKTILDQVDSSTVLDNGCARKDLKTIRLFGRKNLV
jgi:hypothetical protein